MDPIHAKKLLGLPADGTLTAHALKSQFRIASRIHHPDVGGDAAAFIMIKEAYDWLLANANLVTDQIQDLVTFEGRRLSDLGKGYPLTVSAKTCEGCEGKGYKAYHRQVHPPCSQCGGTGLVRFPCRHCNGTGKYIHPNTGREVGQCRSCSGSGWFYPFSKWHPLQFGMDMDPKPVPGTDKPGIPCKRCRGTGEDPFDLRPTKEVLAYFTCTVCDGIGEIKMANPVLPRGYFTSGAPR